MKKFTDKILHHHDHHDEEKHDDKLDKQAQHTHPDVHLHNLNPETHTHHGKTHNFGTGIDNNVSVDELRTLSSSPIVEMDALHHDEQVLPNIVHEHINPPIVDTIIRPTIVEETIRREKVIEIQPIVHRRVDVPEVHHIEKHLYEKLPPAGPATITKQAIIEETIQPHITEDIRTVIHREVPQPYVIHEEKHLTEHIVKPTLHTSEVIQEQGLLNDQPTVVAQERNNTTNTHSHTHTTTTTEKLSPPHPLEKRDTVAHTFMAAGGPITRNPL